MLPRALTRSLGLTLLISAFAGIPSAHAQGTQVSDADRAAARELYIEGVKLQEQGKFEGALERFQRAQAVFSAPTHLLHIAECQAALGRLVESAETYRTLVRTPLPPGSPNAFVHAQQQGSAELTQVEPRVPTLKLVVKPENVQNLSVQIDGQPMSAALVGVPRPANPGEHHVTVFAPGYGKSETKVALKEKEQRELPIVLQPTSGVVYGPAVTPLPAQQSSTGPTYSTTPQAQTQPQTQGPAEQPPVYQGSTQETPSKKKGPTTSFMVGPHIGLEVPAGNFSSTGADANTKISDVHAPGVGFGIDGGLRFARIFYLGLVFDHGIYGRGSSIDTYAKGASSGLNVTSTNASNYFGGNFVWISNPEGIGFWGEIGVGYRWLSTSLKVEDAASLQNREVNFTYHGPEASIGVGIHLRLAQAFRLVPKVTVGGGSFSKLNQSCTSSAVDGCTGYALDTSTDIPNTDTHTFVFVGVGGYFDFGKREP